jgi:hypothetical protein
MSCSCGQYVGITYKGLTHTKIFRCHIHGLICPFCNDFQSKDIDAFEKHIYFCKKTSIDNIQEAIFELYVYKTEVLLK